MNVSSINILITNELSYFYCTYFAKNQEIKLLFIEVLLLKDIKEIGFCYTLGIVPNGLFITTNSGIEKYVVNNRKIWKDKIEIQKQNL